MQIFIHTPNGIAFADDLDATATIADLMDKAGLTDSTAWLEDVEDPLDPGAVVSTVAGDKAHIHVNRCRRIDVTIQFAGQTKARQFPPGATIQAVRSWAVGPDGFDLPAKERPRHEVGVCGSGVIADRNDHVGTLATDCGLCLDLAPKDRFQG